MARGKQERLGTGLIVDSIRPLWVDGYPSDAASQKAGFGHYRNLESVVKVSVVRP
jgi:hypothetical protein